MGIFGRFRGTGERPDGPAPLAAQLSPAQLGELRETARQRIRPGFQRKGELPAELTAYLDDFNVEPAAVLAAATEIVDQEWADRLAEQQEWHGDSDFDRLSQAFNMLATQGIVARMNFTCCQTCGTDEIDDERTPLPDAGDDYAFREWGYTFFHQQDAERLSDDLTTLFLSYSTFRPPPGMDEALLDAARAGDDAARTEVIRQSDVTVGAAVSEALRNEGLAVDWDGSNARRIQVTVTDWRKPLPQD